jgi:hypothetical protein
MNIQHFKKINIPFELFFTLLFEIDIVAGIFKHIDALKLTKKAIRYWYQSGQEFYFDLQRVFNILISSGVSQIKLNPRILSAL